MTISQTKDFTHKREYKKDQGACCEGPALSSEGGIRPPRLELCEPHTIQTSVLSATPALPNSGLEGFPGTFNPGKLFPHLLPSVEAHPVAAGPIMLQVLLVLQPGLIIGNGTGLCIQHYLGQGILFGSRQGNIQPRSMESSFEVHHLLLQRCLASFRPRRKLLEESCIRLMEILLLQSAQRLGHFVRKRLYIDVAQTIFYLALRVVTFHRLLRSLFGRKVQTPCQPIKTRGSRARRQLSWRVLHPKKGRLQRCHRRSSGKSLQKRLAKRSLVVFGSFSPSSTRSLPPSTFDCLGGCFYVSNHLGGGHGGQDSPGGSGNLFGRPRRRGRLFMAPAAGTTSCSVERIVVGIVATTPLATTPAGAETSVASATSSRRTGDTAPSLLLLEEAPAVLLVAPCSAPPTWEALESSLSFEQV
ncbi:hypothetical protein Taro_021311 [Colocasia esculenta]|uniref:Uncharacterized protein n=1 Tax=Colocasia esculenta TaxID=4460 RepID=A0A843V7T7_COLES|nr:hypothetical protein [Colocasia esculenta]